MGFSAWYCLLLPVIITLKTHPTVLCQILAACFISMLSAADRTWDGLGADDFWSNLDNWDGVAPVAGDALFFGGGVRTTPINNILADTSFSGLTFNSGAGAFTLSGNRLTLGGNILNSSSNLQVISLAMILDATRTVDTGASGIILSRVLSGPGGILKQGSGTLTLSGAEANTYDGLTEVTAGQVTLAKTGGVNAVSGDITLSGAGTALVYAASGAQNQIANDATVTLSGVGSVLGNTAASFGMLAGSSQTVSEEIANLNVSDGMFYSGSGTWTISGAGVFDGTSGDVRYLHNSAGTVSFGSLSLIGMTGTTAATAADTFAVLGNNAIQTSLFVGAGGLSLDGSRLVLFLGSNAGVTGNRLVLDGNVSTTGTTASFIQSSTSLGTVGQTLVQLSSTAGDHTRTFTVGGGAADLTVSVAITNGAATNGGILKSGVGTLFLTGTTANTYSGLTTVSEGILSLGKTGSVNAIGGNLTVSGTGDVIFAVTGSQDQIANGASVVVNGTGGTTGSTFNGTEANAGVAVVTESIGALSVLNGNFNTGAGSIWTVTGAGIFDSTGAADSRFIGNSGSVANFGSLSLTAMTGTTVTAAKGFGLGGANSVIVTTVTVGAGGLVLDGSILALNRGASAPELGSRLVLNGNVTTTGTSASSIALGNLGTFGKGDVELSGTAGSHVRTFTIGGGGANLTVGAAITNGAATTGGILKNGAGTMTLSGINTYSGDTTVSEGILAIGASERINDTSNLNVTGTGTFNLGASLTETVGAVSVSTTAGGISGTGTSTLIGSSYLISNVSGTATISVSLGGGAATLDKTGAGTLLLSGGAANTYSGLTTVAAGVLSLGKTGGVVAVSGNLTVSGTGDVIFAGSGAQNQIANGAAVIVNGTGSTLNGIGANDGIVTVTETIGSLSVLNGNFNTGAGSNWTVAGAGIFDGTGAADTRFIGNSGSVTSFNSLSLTAMTGTVIVSSSDSFVLGGNAATASTVRVGAGGLTLNGSTIGLNWGTGSLQGSRIVLDGDVTTNGTTASSIIRVGGTVDIGKSDVELSSTSGDHVRTFDIGGGGADLTVGAAITNGAATNGGITKEGAGVLILTGTNTYTGNTTVSEGVLTIATTGALPGWNTNGRYSVANGATLAVRNAVTDGNITTMLATTNFAAGSSIGFDTSAANRTYALNLTDTAQGSLGLTKLGANNLVLTGANNTYSGETRVLEGALIVNGNQANATGAVSVNAGATLGGAGTIGGDTTISGNLRVGSSLAAGTTGSLSFGGEDLTFANGSTWFIDIVGATGDSINGVDVLTIDSNATLNFNFSGPTQESYTLATYGSRANENTFSGFADGAVFSGYQITYGNTAITLTAIPEPGTLAILGLGLSGLLLRRIRRHRAARE